MGTYNDFSQLKKLKPAEPVAPKPTKPLSPADRALAGAATSTDYFSSLLGPREVKKEKKPAAATGVPQPRTTVVTPATVARVREEQAQAKQDALEAAAAAREATLREELEVQQEVSASLATELATANTAREEAETALAELRQATCEAAEKQAQEIAALEAALAQARVDLATAQAAPKEDPELAAQLEAAQEQLASRNAQYAELEAKHAQTKEQLKDALRTSLSSAVLLDKPAGFSEKFAGEIHAHVVEALADAYRAAEAGGRERRARILEAILAANPSLGELEQRRTAVKQIVKDAGKELDNAALAELEALGFRYISGNKHHKLDWAGIRFPLSKTPSDYRACLNSAAEINNRVF